MEKIQVFLDTDVVVSSLLSKTGASYEIIKNPNIRKVISKGVGKEVAEAAKRLNIHKQKTEYLFKKIKITTLNLTKKKLLLRYKKITIDKKDCHVVAGANITKSKFLLTYNIKHYKVEKIKDCFGIIVLKPGYFLQYLRSLGKF